VGASLTDERTRIGVFRVTVGLAVRVPMLRVSSKVRFSIKCFPAKVTSSLMKKFEFNLIMVSEKLHKYSVQVSLMPALQLKSFTCVF